MHEVNAYGAWMAQAGVPGSVGGYESVADPDQLRATGQYRVLTPAELVAELQAKGPYGAALFHPLMGGIPPEMAWESLHLFESEVLRSSSDPAISGEQRDLLGTEAVRHLARVRPRPTRR